MHRSTTSTTFVTPVRREERPYTLHLNARGPIPQSWPMTPLASPTIHGFQNLPLPEVSDSYDWRNQGPPPLNYSLSPYATVPLPRLTSGGLDISEMLEYAPVSMIDYNLTQHPSFATLSVRRTAGARSFDEPATFPGITSVTIRAPFSQRPIVIHRFGAIITVRDVLTDVYERLRECACEQSRPRPVVDLMGIQPQFDRASEAQIQRSLVQLLGNRYRWAGLSPCPTEPDVWLLHIR